MSAPDLPRDDTSSSLSTGTLKKGKKAKSRVSFQGDTSEKKPKTRLEIMKAELERMRRRDEDKERHYREYRDSVRFSLSLLSDHRLLKFHFFITEYCNCRSPLLRLECWLFVSLFRRIQVFCYCMRYGGDSFGTHCIFRNRLKIDTRIYNGLPVSEVMY